MKVELNTDKSPFCTIGQYSFTYAEPAHDIELESLSDELKKQLMYNLRREVLFTEEKEKIQEIVESAPAPRFVTPAEVPLVKPEIQQTDDPVEEDLKSLRALLKGSVATIKRESKDFRVARLRKLRSLEEAGKNRKSLVTFLQEQLIQHQASVASVVAGPDIVGMHALDPQGLSTQVGDIVESEGEELVLSQDVLNQLGD